MDPYPWGGFGLVTALARIDQYHELPSGDQLGGQARFQAACRLYHDHIRRGEVNANVTTYLVSEVCRTRCCAPQEYWYCY